MKQKSMAYISKEKSTDFLPKTQFVGSTQIKPCEDLKPRTVFEIKVEICLPYHS